jgi:hypothetical protein
MIANYYMNLIIYFFIKLRETRTAKTIRQSFYGLKLMTDTNKNDGVADGRWGSQQTLF